MKFKKGDIVVIDGDYLHNHIGVVTGKNAFSTVRDIYEVQVGNYFLHYDQKNLTLVSGLTDLQKLLWSLE